MQFDVIAFNSFNFHFQVALTKQQREELSRTFINSTSFYVREIPGGKTHSFPAFLSALMKHFLRKLFTSITSLNNQKKKKTREQSESKHKTKLANLLHEQISRENLLRVFTS